MKAFEEQRYKHVQAVSVKPVNGEAFEDEIKGLNAGHAYHLAKLNWEGAEITLIDKIKDSDVVLINRGD